MDNDEKRIREEWFKDHQARYYPYTCKSIKNDVIEKITWKKPGTSAYYVSYVYQNGTLFVSGDLGEAIYCWAPDMSFEQIASCNISYFHGKCRASEVGFPFNEWSEEKAKKYLEDCFSLDSLDFNNGINFNTEVITDYKEEFRKKRIKQKMKEIIDYYGTETPWADKGSWEYFLGEQGYEIFGSDYFEFGNIGEQPHLRCRAHLIGLKMAFTQIREPV
jgi:hypothetical protein